MTGGRDPAVVGHPAQSEPSRRGDDGHDADQRGYAVDPQREPPSTAVLLCHRVLPSQYQCGVWLFQNAQAAHGEP